MSPHHSMASSSGESLFNCQLSLAALHPSDGKHFKLHRKIEINKNQIFKSILPTLAPINCYQTRIFRLARQCLAQARRSDRRPIIVYVMSDCVSDFRSGYHFSTVGTGREVLSEIWTSLACFPTFPLTPPPNNLSRARWLSRIYFIMNVPLPFRYTSFAPLLFRLFLGRLVWYLCRVRVSRHPGRPPTPSRVGFHVIPKSRHCCCCASHFRFHFALKYISIGWIFRYMSCLLFSLLSFSPRMGVKVFWRFWRIFQWSLKVNNFQQRLRENETDK